MLRYFKESKLYDCRISAFPFLEDWYIKLHGPQTPDILFIDLDASQFKSERALNLALAQTLRNIRHRFNNFDTQPTILESGSGGYHIIQPLQVIDLGRVDQFSKRSTDPNKDHNHYNNVSTNNYLLRVPNSIDSKSNTKVKIVQMWNGVRPDVRFVYSYFLAYLVDKRSLKRCTSASSNNWIEYCKSKRSDK